MSLHATWEIASGYYIWMAWEALKAMPCQRRCLPSKNKTEFSQMKQEAPSAHGRKVIVNVGGALKSNISIGIIEMLTNIGVGVTRAYR